MDNLEKELLEKLTCEFRCEFDSQEEINVYMQELNGPFAKIKKPSVKWKQRVPTCMQENWDHIPLHTKFLLMMMTREIVSLNLMCDDYQEAFESASSRTK